MRCKMRIRLVDSFSFFEYEFDAPSVDYAMNHFEAIKAGGFTRHTEGATMLEHFMPSQIAFLRLSLPDGETFSQKYGTTRVIP